MSPIQGGATLDPSGYDAGKKVVGRKRHLLTDTIGMLLAVRVHPANVQDRDGAEPLLRQARRLFPFIERIIGDAGYQGPKMAAVVARTGTWKMQIVRRCDRHRFVVLPRRWLVERTIGWISRNRRLARDFERHCRIAAAFVRMAMIRIMLRRLAARPLALLCRLHSSARCGNRWPHRGHRARWASSAASRRRRTSGGEGAGGGPVL